MILNQVRSPPALLLEDGPLRGLSGGSNTGLYVLKGL